MIAQTERNNSESTWMPADEASPLRLAQMLPLVSFDETPNDLAEATSELMADPILTFLITAFQDPATEFRPGGRGHEHY